MRKGIVANGEDLAGQDRGRWVVAHGASAGFQLKPELAEGGIYGGAGLARGGATGGHGGAVSFALIGSEFTLLYSRQPVNNLFWLSLGNQKLNVWFISFPIIQVLIDVVFIHFVAVFPFVAPRRNEPFCPYYYHAGFSFSHLKKPPLECRLDYSRIF